MSVPNPPIPLTEWFADVTERAEALPDDEEEPGEPTALALGMNASQGTWYSGPRVYSNVGRMTRPQYADPAQSPIGQNSVVIESAYTAEGWLNVPSGGVWLPTRTSDMPQGTKLRVEIVGSTTVSGFANMKFEGLPSTLLSDTGNGVDRRRVWEVTLSYDANDHERRSLCTFANGGLMKKYDVRETTRDLGEVYPAEVIAYFAQFPLGPRAMDWFGTNENFALPLTAAYRPKPTHLFPHIAGYCFEDIIDLAAAAGTGLWNCFPASCDQSYVDALLDYAHPRIAPGRQIPLEVANEWGNPGFAIFNWADQQWRAHYASLGDTTQNAIAWQVERTNVIMGYVTAWATRNSVSIGKGNATRLRRVMGDLTGSYANVRSRPNVDHSTFDTVATAPYFGRTAQSKPTIATTSDQILRRFLVQTGVTPSESIDANVTQTMGIAALAATDGHDHIGYEGGTHDGVDGAGDYISEAMSRSVIRNPKLKPIYRYYLRELHRCVPTMRLWLFTDIGHVGTFGHWGHQEYQGQPLSEAPRLAAALDAMAGAAAPDSYFPIEIINAPGEAKANASFSFKPAVFGGLGLGLPKSWTATGLPQGWSLDAQTGEISGVTTQSGQATITMTVADSTGASDAYEFAIPITPATAFVSRQNFNLLNDGPYEETGLADVEVDITFGGSTGSINAVFGLGQPNQDWIIFFNGEIFIRSQRVTGGYVEHGGGGYLSMAADSRVTIRRRVGATTRAVTIDFYQGRLISSQTIRAIPVGTTRVGVYRNDGAAAPKALSWSPAA